MPRRSKWSALFILFAGVAAVAGTVLYLAKRAPAFYAHTPPSTFETQIKATQLLTRVQDLKNEIRSKPEWGDTFTADELNCFFVENMSPGGGLASMLPEGMRSPRIAIEGDRVKLGFKYGEGVWSTVLWVELKVWLVANEVNLVAVEVCDLRTGCLSLGSQSVLDSISEAARDSNIEVTWYRNGSNPVGLFRFFAGQPLPTSQILTLDVKDDKIIIAGRTSQDQSPAQPAGPTPVGPMTDE